MKPPLSTIPGTGLDQRTAGFLLGLSLLVHLAGMLAAEFTGADEMLFAAIARAYTAGLTGNVNELFRAFSFYYPPLQALLPAPLIALFGLHPWTLRLPGAVAGALAAPLLYLLMRRHGCSRQAAFLAGLLSATGSVAANHYYALTCGLFAAFALIGAWGLADFIVATDEPRERRSLILGTLGITAAMMTLQDGFFYIPVLAAAYIHKRGFRIARADWVAFAILGAWIAGYLIFWFIVPALLGDGSGGGAFKVRTALSQLGAWRLRELGLSGVAGSSWIAALLFGALLVPGWQALSRGLRWVALFYVVPLATWTFVLDYPNVRSAHMLLAFPAFAMLWGRGATAVTRRLRAAAPRLIPAWQALIALACLSVAWQTLALHSPIVLSESTRSFMTLRGFYPQGRWIERFGQARVGRWIQKRTPPDVAVICNLGGAFGDVYAQRPVRGLNELAHLADDPAAAKAANVRFYAHFTAGPSDYAPDPAIVPLAAMYGRKGQIVAVVYDLWRATTETEVLE